MFAIGPTPELVPYAYAFALAMAAIAALTDWRTGHIPHWLTLPPLVIAPLVHGLAQGAPGLAGSMLAIVLCGAIPLLVFKLGGMAGGDVKLFAAIGAVAGADAGIQIEFLSFIVAAIYAIGRLAWDGKLLRALGNSFYVGLNPLLPRRMRRPIAPELLHTLRLGAAIFAGTLIALYGRLESFLVHGS